MESLKESLDHDRDIYQARRTATELYHLLERFIPDACRREMLDYTMEQCYKHGVELTTKAMRKQYEAWQKTQVDMLMLKPNIPVQPND